MTRRDILKKGLAAGAILGMMPAPLAAAVEKHPTPHRCFYGSLGDGRQVTVLIYDEEYRFNQGYKELNEDFAVEVFGPDDKRLVSVKWNGDIMDFADDELHPYSEACHRLTCTEGDRFLYTVSVDPM